MPYKSYLLDTNIFLEILLEQRKAKECKILIEKLIKGGFNVYISDFSFFSIAIKMTKSGKIKEFFEFKNELIDSGYLKVERLEPDESFDKLYFVLETLSFDDAYQYMLCKTKNIALITLDSDFDHIKDIRVFTPEDVLRILQD